MLVEIDEDLYDALFGLVKAGKYKDLDQAIEVAALNQIKLERNQSGLVSGSRPGEKTGKKDSPGLKEKTEEAERKDNILDFLKVPEGKQDVVVAPTPESLIFPGYMSEEQMFLWGQFNRILPGKVGLRVLSNLVAESPDNTHVPFNDFKKLASEVARGFGEFVRDLDDQHGRKRSDRFSNGFPIGKDQAKSISRYMNHFLGRKRKSDNILDGYLARLKFVNILVSREGNLFVGLTEAGLAFSKIDNQLITGSDAEWPLSGKDIEFYLGHVLENVPEERVALVEVLGYVNKGNAHPTQIDEILAQKTRVKHWTSAMVVTNRAGTLSRLWELKLVVRTGDKGDAYQVTRGGRRFLEAAEKLDDLKFDFF